MRFFSLAVIALTMVSVDASAVHNQAHAKNLARDPKHRQLAQEPKEQHKRPQLAQ